MLNRWTTTGATEEEEEEEEEEANVEDISVKAEASLELDEEVGGKVSEGKRGNILWARSTKNTD